MSEVKALAMTTKLLNAVRHAIEEAYVRGAEWRQENPGTVAEYRFKAGRDYADKTLSDPGREISKALRSLPEQPAVEGEDTDEMERISALIARLQDVLTRFGDTCVYIRRGGLSWGAVALNRQADDKEHGVFDLQATHDREMEERLEQVERLIADRNEWRERAWKAEATLASPLPAPSGWQPIETAPKDGTEVLLYAPGWKAPNTGWTYDDIWQDCPFSHKGNPSYTPTHWQPLPAPPTLDIPTQEKSHG